MSITSLDILNLSHSLKDICEVNCGTSECLSQTLKVLLQYNLIQANLAFSRQFDCPPEDPCRKPEPDGRRLQSLPKNALKEEICTGLDIANPNRNDK